MSQLHMHALNSTYMRACTGKTGSWALTCVQPPTNTPHVQRTCVQQEQREAAYVDMDKANEEKELGNTGERAPAQELELSTHCVLS